ncbi:MAG: RNA methyltransferase [Prevotellaceae bacterium]|jgi:tRNA (guanosine-2'-O-)-methyltransferase|nr:RNA methyltransferase [Prevotellaceae bacterium]
MNMPLNRYLEQFVHDKRVELLRQKLLQRTRYLCICLEDIYQSQNASAVLRTCEAFGIQDVHIVEDKNKYQINPMVVKGSVKWLSLYKYNSPQPSYDAVQYLKNHGYRIVATSPYGDNVALEDFDITKGKTAVFFGTEYSGISDTVRKNADEFITVPMFGFVESFNISVSAAIILHQLIMQLRKSTVAWQLSEDEQNTIMLQWLRSTIRSADKIIELYETLQNHNQNNEINNE